MADVIRLEDLEPLDQIAERPSVIKRLRDHHHLMARLCAEGKRTSEIAAETGMSISRVSVLKGDPAFNQLVEMYRANYNQMREAIYSDVMRKYALLEANGLDHRNDQYEEDPDSICEGSARADVELAQRALGRQVHKSFNVNADVSQPLAERLEEQRLRAERLSARALPAAKEPEDTEPPAPGDKDG